MRLLAVAAGWAWAAIIVWLSLTPSSPPVEFAASDKLGHLLAYAALMFWFARLYRTRIFYAAGFVAMGLGLEYAQGWLGFRAFDPLDMAANTLGVLAGWAAALSLPGASGARRRQTR